MRFLWVFLVILPSIAAAEWNKVRSAQFPIPSPPAEDSVEFFEDFRQLHILQMTRTEEQCDLARKQEHPYFDSLFGYHWKELSKEEKDLARPLVSKMMRLSDRISGYHKDKFRRPRPYDTDPTLEPCGIKPGGSKSYPSSHAAIGAAGACALALIFPAKKDSIERYGDYLGELRLISGVHHPSDVAAGRELGKAICRWAQGEADFQEELKATLIH